MEDKIRVKAPKRTEKLSFAEFVQKTNISSLSTPKKWEKYKIYNPKAK